jgi:hypothetical protein
MDNAWSTKAKCQDAPDPDLFFSGPVEAARKFCGECPVIRQCEAAGAGERFGIWGGKWWYQATGFKPRTIKQRRYHARMLTLISAQVTAPHAD